MTSLSSSVSKGETAMSVHVGLLGEGRKNGGQVSALSPRKTKRLYTLDEAAAYLGRSIWSVRRLIWNGDLPSVRVAKRVHLDLLDMDEFIDKHKVTEGA